MMASGPSGDGGSHLSFGANPSPASYIGSFNARSSDMTSNRVGTTPFSSHFTFVGGSFIPPSSTQSTNNNPSFNDSAPSFGSISAQQFRSPPPPSGNLETRLPVIPTPPPSQPSAALARQTYATSTPGIRRHASNDSVSAQSTPLHHQHHAPAVHSPSSDGGPPFDMTEALHRLYLPGTMAGEINLAIHPKVDRGFFVAPEDNEWTCYRRNYFQLSCAYSITSQNPALSDESLLGAGIMLDYHGRQERVLGFKLTIGARVFGSDQKIIDLVQHTPKRDKGPQLKPALLPMLPGGDVERHGHRDGTEIDEEKVAEGVDLPKVVTYERIQFKQATANNGKRRAAQQYFSLIVEAYASILGLHGAEDVRVAVTKSSPVVVRGRSPGHYSDNPLPEGAVPKRPPELTNSTSFLRSDQPSPTSIKSTPVVPTLNNPTNASPTSIPQTTSGQNPDTELPQNTQNNSLGNDTDFLASLEADFDGYQYLPSTLLDPQGKIVVPHDLFYDPHEFPDAHYANLFSTDPSLTFPNDPAATTFNSNANNSGTLTNDGEFANLYQGLLDLPVQSETNWNAMGRAPSTQGTVSQSPFPKDRLPVTSNPPSQQQQQQPQPQPQQQQQQQQISLDNTNWFDSFQPSNQNVLSSFRPNNNITATTAPPSQSFNMGFQNTQGDTNGGGGGGTNGNGNGSGKWMFEFRNSSYGYFPNLPALGDINTT